MSNESFIPNDYEAPKSGGGFTKLETGENRLRILSSPLMMWLEWRDGKPSRHKFDPNNKPAKGPAEKDSIKHAWGLIVWNYKTEKIEVLELDKQEIIGALTAHAKDEDWGHPKHYDIVIVKSGSGMDTEYKLLAKPKKEPSQVIIDAFIENPIDLSKLLTQDNPFLSNGGDAASTAPAPAAKKEVTPDNWTAGDEIPSGFQVEDGKLVKKKMPF